MRPAAVAIALCGIVAAAVVVLDARSFLVPQPQQAAPSPANAAPQGEPAAPASADDGTASAAAVRMIAPDRVAVPDVDPARLQREAPRPPLSAAAAPAMKTRKPTTLIYNPVADAAGRISGQGAEVTLANVRIVEPDETCTDDNGRRWPCGMMARTAFRAFLRGRAVDCALPADLTVTKTTVACKLGNQDVGAWVVANGWGLAVPGGPYEQQGRAARDQHLGIFSEAPAPVAELQTLSPPPPLSGPAPLTGYDLSGEPSQ